MFADRSMILRLVRTVNGDARVSRQTEKTVPVWVMVVINDSGPPSAENRRLTNPGPVAEVRVA